MPMTGSRILTRRAAWAVLFACWVVLLASASMPARADGPPKPDPAGAATGTAADAQNASGAIIPAEPTDKSASDYAEKNKAYQETKAQMEREPFAKSLADGVGQNRVAINIVWTLFTGFL